MKLYKLIMIILVANIGMVWVQFKFSSDKEQKRRLFQETEAFAAEIADEFVDLINICLEHKEDLKNIQNL